MPSNTQPPYTLQALFEEQIRDLYDAQLQYGRMLPSFIDSATATDLQEILQQISSEVSQRIVLIKEICAVRKIAPDGVTCEAMRGLIREGAEAENWENSAVRDAAIIANAQRVTHYEIAGFGTAREFARCLRDQISANILRTLVSQSSEMDKELTRIATGGWFSTGINHEALVPAH